MTQLHLPQPNQPNVQIINNQAITSSLDVADYFDKQHKNVIQRIQNLKKLNPEFGRLNFKPSNYTNSQGKKQPYFLMTRAGFSVAVLGFTGDKALTFQIAYVNRFEEMEAQLFPKRKQLDAPSTKEDRKPLTNLVSTLVDCAPFSFRNAWHMVHAHMGGKHAEEFTLAELPVAMAFVQEQINLHTVKTEPAAHKLSDEYKANEKELTALYEELGQSAAMEMSDLKNPDSTLSLIFRMRRCFKETLNIAVNYEKILVDLQKFEAGYVRFCLFKKMLGERK